MKLYLVCDDPNVDADLVIHTGRTITIRGRGKTRLPDCSSVEFAKNFYKKLSRYPGIRLAVDMSDEKKEEVPPTPAEEKPQEEKKEEVPPPETAQEPEKKEETPPPAQAEAPAAEEAVPPMDKSALLKMTKPELVKMAKEKGIEGAADLSKAQIVEKILG